MLQNEQDVLPKSLIEEILKTLDSFYFPWYVTFDVSKTDHILKKVKDFKCVSTYQLSHNIIKDGELVSPKLIDLNKQIISHIFSKFKIEKGLVTRSKLNLLFTNNKVTNDVYNIPHVDVEKITNKDEKSLVLYLTESDGYTVFFNEKFGEDFDKFTIYNKIYPKQNSAVMFDGDIYHTSQNPIKYDRRVVLNLNFKILDK